MAVSRYVHGECQIVMRTQLAQFISAIFNLQTDKSLLILTSIKSLWKTYDTENKQFHYFSTVLLNNPDAEQVLSKFLKCI
jgi:hypothetical protein